MRMPVAPSTSHSPSVRKQVELFAANTVELPAMPVEVRSATWAFSTRTSRPPWPTQVEGPARAKRIPGTTGCARTAWPSSRFTTPSSW